MVTVPVSCAEHLWHWHLFTPHSTQPHPPPSLHPLRACTPPDLYTLPCSTSPFLHVHGGPRHGPRQGNQAPAEAPHVLVSCGLQNEIVIMVPRIVSVCERGGDRGGDGPLPLQLGLGRVLHQLLHDTGHGLLVGHRRGSLGKGGDGSPVGLHLPWIMGASERRQGPSRRSRPPNPTSPLPPHAHQR
jgi:hypothetical protein